MISDTPALPGSFRPDASLRAQETDLPRPAAQDTGPFQGFALEGQLQNSFVFGERDYQRAVFQPCCAGFAPQRRFGGELTGRIDVERDPVARRMSGPTAGDVVEFADP